MKKSLLLLALALMGLTANAETTFSITYTPELGTPQTLSEGTHDLGNRQGTITIKGNEITFDNVVIVCENGFQIIPSDLTDNYVLYANFKGYNSIYSLETAALDFSGSPSQIILQGDALRALHYDGGAAIVAGSGSIRSDILELSVGNDSFEHYTIEMGAGEKLDISTTESYRRVHIFNFAGRGYENSPISDGLIFYEDDREPGIFYGTPNSQNVLPAYIGSIKLNEGNLPYISRFVPGLKRGTVTAEDHVSESGAFFHFNIKDVVIETNVSDIFYTGDANMVLNVEGTNSITGSHGLLSSHILDNDMRGNLKVVGKGTDAQLTLHGYVYSDPVIYTNGFASFENLTMRAYAHIGEFTSSSMTWVMLCAGHEGGDPDDYELVIKKNAKVLLAQKGNISDETPGLIYGFTNMGGSNPNLYANPDNGLFVDGQLVDEEGNLLHEAYFGDVKDEEEGIFHTTQAVKAQKILRDGQLLIHCDGKTYNIFGNEVR